jgi:hypothetical protein
MVGVPVVDIFLRCGQAEKSERVDRRRFIFLKFELSEAQFRSNDTVRCRNRVSSSKQALYFHFCRFPSQSLSGMRLGQFAIQTTFN